MAENRGKQEKSPARTQNREWTEIRGGNNPRHDVRLQNRRSMSFKLHGKWPTGEKNRKHCVGILIAQDHERMNLSEIIIIIINKSFACKETTMCLMKRNHLFGEDGWSGWR